MRAVRNCGIEPRPVRTGPPALTLTQVLVNLELNRQAVAVPAKLALDMEAGGALVPGHRVLRPQ